jgi:hypothetical protein
MILGMLWVTPIFPHIVLCTRDGPPCERDLPRERFDCIIVWISGIITHPLFLWPVHFLSHPLFSFFCFCSLVVCWSCRCARGLVVKSRSLWFLDTRFCFIFRFGVLSVLGGHLWLFVGRGPRFWCGFGGYCSRTHRHGNVFCPSVSPFFFFFFLFIYLFI